MTALIVSRTAHRSSRPLSTTHECITAIFYRLAIPNSRPPPWCKVSEHSGKRVSIIIWKWPEDASRRPLQSAWIHFSVTKKLSSNLNMAVVSQPRSCISETSLLLSPLSQLRPKLSVQCSIAFVQVSRHFGTRDANMAHAIASTLNPVSLNKFTYWTLKFPVDL